MFVLPLEENTVHNLSAISLAMMLLLAASPTASACYVSKGGDPSSPNGSILSIIYDPKFKNCAGTIRFVDGHDLRIAYKPRHMKLKILKDNSLHYTLEEGFPERDLAVITGVSRGKPVKLRFHIRHADTVPAADRRW